jgi:hypothetical protein
MTKPWPPNSSATSITSPPPTKVHHFLGTLLKQLVHKRVRRRDAMAQAYLCQLLLNTFPHLRRETEEETDREGCEELLKGFLEDRKAARAKQDSPGDSSVSPISPARA